MQIFQLCIYTERHFGLVVRSSGEQPRGLVFTALLSGGGCAGLWGWRCGGGAAAMGDVLPSLSQDSEKTSTGLGLGVQTY